MVKQGKYGLTDIEKASKADLIPKGEYLVQVPPLKEEFSPDGSKTFLKGYAKIIGPVGCKVLGRTLPLKFLVEGDSETAVSIGHRQLAQLFKAAGKPNADDTDEMTGARVIAVADIRQFDGRDFQVVSAFRPDPSAPKAPPKAPSPEPAPAPAPAQADNADGIPF